MPSSTQANRTTAQSVTPELRRWIIEQAQAGFAAPVVLQSMRDAGWDEDVAAQALEATLQDHLNELAVQQGLPAAVPVPEPALDESPALLDAGDRQVSVLLAMVQPRIVVLGNLLSDEECEALIAAAEPRMARSLTVATKTGGEEVNDDRTSDGMFFQRGESPLLQRIEQRIARLLQWPVENGEGLQVLHYRPGAEYKPHYDYFDPAEPGTPTIVKRGGQRVGTLVMYLNTPEKGGGTVFPDVHMEVAPQRGNAVFFSYERPHPSTRTLHGGAPVIAGHKWIATKWLREREFV
ncbi:2OG-Fe(II) oxygenase [Acidovorax sp. RAC01]|uniref:2OG-Fe(II) oxygenase n=1 Tax=Acidovorax sp. RAC01 TaxID=1842533 RepID=UPI00083E93F5|nr:2OG-Fe(II) oxygenase [Acidovorax sp. RAC01]AOG25225.1 2OG-Fe(II) oxygenase superfamily protein [Acidovorax sp. RAC01]